MSLDSKAVKEQSRRTANTSSQQGLTDADAVAAICGMSTRTVYRFADSGRMPWGVKLGSLRRWDISKIEAWIAGGCKPVRAVRGGDR